MGRPAKHSSNVEGHRTINELEDKKEREQLAGDFPSISLSAPDWLDDVAKDEYERVVKFLVDLNVTVLDQTSLAMYANSYSQYREAVKEVKENGLYALMTTKDGDVFQDMSKKNPAIGIMNDMSKEIRAYASSLGMTLDSRTKLMKPPEKPDSNDPYASFGDDSE